jgi:hypothetical protein
MDQHQLPDLAGGTPVNRGETPNPQPNVIVVPPGGGGGGGFFSRVFGAIIASCLISGVGYFATYTTLFARLWLRKEGATVEMPAEKAANKAKPGIVERGRTAIDELIGKTRENLAKTKANTAGVVEKAREKSALLGKAIEHKVDAKAQELKDILARRKEEAEKRREEAAQQLAADKAKYDEWVQKFREHYDAQCPRCHAPLRTRNHSVNKSVACAKCQFVFTVRRARALGPPKPPPFHPAHRSLWGQIFR